MSAQGKWIEQFGFSKAVGGAKSVPAETLFRILAEGRLPEAEYFAWAQAAFELPLIKSEFFGIPADPVFWDRVKDVHAWSAHLFPIADWDGVLLIACVEPPADASSIRAPHRFVLATARDLGSHWKKLNPSLSAAVAPPAAAPVLDFNAAADIAPAAAPAEMPDGFQFSVSPNTMNINLEMPDGFSAGADVRPTSELPDGFGFSTTDLPAVSEMPDGFAPTSISPTPPASTLIATPPLPPPPPPAPTMEAPVASQPLAMPSAAVPEAAEPVEFTQTGFTITNSPDPDWVQVVDPKPLKTCQSMEELATHTLSAVARHFTGGLVFVAKGDGFTPWRFTAPFRTPRKPFGTLKLDQPNLFRIVERTLLPYHGHTTPAPENDRFFKAFLGGKAPGHVTVVPVILNKKCVGMIMGVADSVLPYRHILPIMEMLAKDFAVHYQRLESTNAAAA